MKVLGMVKRSLSHPMKVMLQMRRQDIQQVSQSIVQWIQLAFFYRGWSSVTITTSKIVPQTWGHRRRNFAFWSRVPNIPKVGLYAPEQTCRAPRSSSHRLSW